MNTQEERITLNKSTWTILWFLRIYIIAMTYALGHYILLAH